MTELDALLLHCLQACAAKHKHTGLISSGIAASSDTVPCNGHYVQFRDALIELNKTPLWDDYDREA